MNREKILKQLRAHRPFDRREEEMRQGIEEFVLQNERCFDRTFEIGHLTASAWILDETRTHALLTHHRQLNLWVQLGGHVENDADLLQAARREAIEESGLREVKPVRNNIFDVDIHEIPENKGDPKHYHYDIRFIFAADRNSPLTISRESKNLIWVPLDRISELTHEESILRMIRKTVAKPQRPI